MHREGKKLMMTHSLNVVENMKGIKYSFAGHVARLDRHDVVRQVLHVRSLAWWRHQQSLPKNKAHSSRGGRPHPKRFNALRRWESPLEEYWGISTAERSSDTVGWMLAAQAREKWRQNRCKLISA